MEGKLFGDIPMDLELRLSGEDSPNSAGVVIALNRGIGGVLEAPSAYFCKHPPRQFTDDDAYLMVEDFVRRYLERRDEMPYYRRGQREQAAA